MLPRVGRQALFTPRGGLRTLAITGCVSTDVKMGLPQFLVNKDLSCFKLWITRCPHFRHFCSYLVDGNPAGKLLALMGSPSISVPRVKQRNALNVLNAAALFIVVVDDGYSIFHAQVRHSG